MSPLDRGLLSWVATLPSTNFIIAAAVLLSAFEVVTTTLLHAFGVHVPLDYVIATYGFLGGMAAWGYKAFGKKRETHSDFVTAQNAAKTPPAPEVAP